MKNFKQIMSGILVCSTLSCSSILPTQFSTVELTTLELYKSEAFKVENLLSSNTLEDNNDKDVIRIPVNPDDGIIRIQTLFINPSSKVSINGKEKNVFGYNINGENFYHIRSLANELKNTTGRFNLDYDYNQHELKIATGYNYTGDTNLDLPIVTDLNNDVKKSEINISVNEAKITINTYNIKGNSFINIKELSQHLGYILDYNAEKNTLNINTETSICSFIKDKVYNPVFTYDPFSKIELSIDDINKILASSSLKDCGQYFYDMQETYNVNIIFAIAVAYLESGRGKYPCGSYNYFGMIGKNFSSKEEGIHAFGKLMNNKLYKAKTIDQIAPIYCNSSWAGKIKNMMNDVWSDL